MNKKHMPAIKIDDTCFSVVDVETTGLSANRNHIIEIGIVKILNYKIVDRYESLINPGMYIPEFITQFTGITNSDIKDAPRFGEIAGKIREFIGDSVVSGHNLSFDSSFLSSEFLRNSVEPLYNDQLCTLKLARRMFPDLKSKSLSSVTKHLRLRNISAHRALSDAEVTARILLKMMSILEKEHDITLLDDLLTYQKRSLPKKSTKIKESLQEDISALPNAPGVYYFINSKNNVIYIGKAKSLRDRIRSYLTDAAPGKAQKIIKHARSLKIELTNTELTALLIEAESIKKINPRHNYQLKKFGNKYFLRITSTQRYPGIEISNQFDFDGNDYFGLFISRKKAEVVLEILDKTFRIRECSDKELAKNKKCFLADIKRCTAPCDNKDIRKYDDELKSVYEFLYGVNQTALNRLLNKMKEYSELEKYEKAAEVKQVIDLILNQTHKTSLLAEPVNSANVLFVVTEDFGKDYILLLEGKIFIKNFPLDKSDRFETALSDYYSRTINYDYLPTEEDLEKMKISLNWLIKNRNKVKTYYLKEFSSKEELYSNISSLSFSKSSFVQKSFDIKDLVNI